MPPDAVSTALPPHTGTKHQRHAPTATLPFHLTTGPKVAPVLMPLPFYPQRESARNAPKARPSGMVSNVSNVPRALSYNLAINGAFSVQRE